MAAAILAGCALLQGCASYDVSVDAIARDEVAVRPASYVIESASAELRAGSLLFQEAAQQLKTALSAHGYWEAIDARSAERVIVLSFGLGRARVTAEPVTLVSLPRPRRDIADLADAHANGGGFGMRPADAANDEFGFEVVEAPVVRREKFLSAVCRANERKGPGRPPPELWRVDVSVETEGADLRGHFPVLAAAVMTQIGRTTEGMERVRVPANDEGVAFINRER